MSLGSIAHLQYYFARTGLLDGKGGHAREYQKKKRADNENVPRLLLTPNARFIDDLTESPTEEVLEPAVVDENEEVMLPPTVSTYSIKTHHIPPPPDVLTLRKDLLDAVSNAEKSIELADEEKDASSSSSPDRTPLSISVSPEPETEDRQVPVSKSPMGWHEIQGMRILDLVTLAIRAAKIYYTAHERPERLAAVTNEREIRQALFRVLDVLKRWAARNFAGGLRKEERASIMGWMADVRAALAHEGRLEGEEAKEREGWVWASGDWTGREREREEWFLHSLMEADTSLPKWTSPEDSTLPTSFLERLRDGRDLVRIHNRAVKKSKRVFCEISAFHVDIAKPYRQAENLRYWAKAAEIRWETKLELDVMGVVYGSSEAAWRQFDTAILAWCKAVREELTRDWGEAGVNDGGPNDRLEV